MYGEESTMRRTSKGHGVIKGGGWGEGAKVSGKAGTEYDCENGEV